MSDERGKDGKDWLAKALANRRWKKKKAHLKEAEKRRQYWSRFTAEQRKEILAKVRAHKGSKARFPGLPDTTRR